MCNKCNDTGWLYETINGVEYAKECECQIQERNKKLQKKHIEESGLSEVLKRMTFENYKITNKMHQAIVERAKSTVQGNKWWFLSGKSGTGKTHITTAICGEFIKQGKRVYYMQWRKDATELKGSIGTPLYVEKLDKLIKSDCLYIDDLFKGNVTEADINLAFTIIDSRYKADLKTLFTTELSIIDILEIDESIGGRINEMCQGDVINIKNMENYRL